MGKSFSFITIIISLLTVSSRVMGISERPAWQDPEVNEINRMAAHADFTNKNEWRMSLHGMWGEIPIPGMWEMNGLGEPMYAGQDYEWKTWWKSNSPQLPDSANYTYTYVRNWTIPSTWKDRDVILHIGSVTSCVEVWCNGHYVGYGEDSKLEQEFDLTKHIRFGKENEIKMLVRRWCDGSYMEDQDFFRYKGFARETYLAARTKCRIEDVKVETLLNDDFTEGSLMLDVKTKGKVKWEASIHNSQFTIHNGNLVIANPKLWSAELPNLYQLHITSDAGDDITIPVGFRRVEIKNAQLLVNGQPVLIKGVNRHELDPDNGYIVSHERMEREVRLLKSWNVNAVRMSHYPNDPYMYDLCDRYGLYVVSETNIETHGMGFKEQTLAKNPLFKKAHMERNQRHVASRRNHPCIIIWSMGNECGYGENFEQVYDWLKVEDPTRSIQFEQAYDTRRCTDIYCPMYPTYERIDAYLANPAKQKPMIMCEYAHAMGNSIGELDEYWSRIRRSPNAQGGFIWDMVDQAKRLSDGSFGYDGDWATTITGDHNFCVNGLFNPDLKPNPHAYEVRYYYQNIWTRIPSGEQSTKSGQRALSIMVFNENFFTDLSDVTMRWQLLCDGVSVKSGSIEELDVQPQDSTHIELPIGGLPNVGEYLLNVDYFRGDERIAYEQLVLQSKSLQSSILNAQCPMVVRFDPQTGFINHLSLADGTLLLKPGTQLRPNFWRAPTDNDYGAKLQRKHRAWLNPKMALTSFEQKGKTTTATYDLPDLHCRLHLKYDIEADGSLCVTQQLVTDSTHCAPDMFRFGMQMQMPHKMENITYYGRGPWENYQNRRAAARLGIYHQTVTDQFHPYVRPQENGTKTDVRWWRLTNDAGRGIEISGSQPLSMSALHYTIDQLDDGIDKNKHILPSSHSAAIPEADCTNLCIDLVQQGQACIDSWSARPLDRYMVHAQDMEYTFRIIPIRKSLIKHQ